MRWRPRLLRGRLQDQAPVVLVVTLVAVAATTLVGVLAGLLHLAENDAIPQTLGRLAPQEVSLEATLWVGGEDAGPALEQARDGLARITGDVPTSEQTWLLGRLHALPAEVGSQPHLTYLAALPAPDEVASLVTGSWPDGAADAQGRVPVAVPSVAAENLGWQVGTTVTGRQVGFDTSQTWLVVGTYEPSGPRSAWSRDRLRGSGTASGFNVPGGSGMVRTTAWGPLVADPAAFAGPDQVDTAYLVVEPHLADATQDAVAGLREQVRDGAATLSEALTGEVSGRLATDVGATIDATWRELVVTRAGVVTIGLLLATLATTVMLLTARLLAERRAGESELLAARGAAPAQLRSVVVLEALTLAGATWLVSPWLARTALDLATRSGALADAGYDVGRGVPFPVLLVCGVMAVVLAVTLCVPAWHTSGSTSRSAHAGLLRAGGDLALVVLGALALWQLSVYGSPLAHSSSGPRLDPVLVAGPALVALAAATLALRAVAPVARGAERLARRARSFVVPHAAWQVARRSSVTTGTVLVVVVAVAAGTFSAAFAATWRTSQIEQVDLALGTDLRADRIEDAPLTASALLAAATAAYPDAHGQPVADRVVGIGERGNTGGLAGRLVAIDAWRPQDVRGRSDVPWSTVLAELPDTPPDRDAGSPLPAGTQWLTVSGVVELPGHTVGGDALVGLTVEDDQGLLTQLPARTTPIGEPFWLPFELPESGALRVVAVEATVVPRDLPDDFFLTAEYRTLPVRLSLTEVGVVLRDAGVRSWTDLDDAPAQRVALTGDGWTAGVRQGESAVPVDVAGATPTGPGGGAMVLDGQLTVTAYEPAPARLLASAWPDRGPVPAAVSASLLDSVDAVAGQVSVAVGGTTVAVRVERVLEHVPGVPRDVGLMVDSTTLGRALVQAGGAPDLLDSWWVAAPEATTAALTEDLVDRDMAVTTRAAEHREALGGPVRVAVPTAVSLVAASAALLVLVGTGAVAAASLRARRLELARLQALGASRPGLVGGLVAESVLLLVVGATAGLLAGYGLAATVAPLLTMSPDGRTPAPPPWLVWGWGTQTLRTLVVVGTAGAVVGIVAALGVRRTSGAALRMGDER